LSIDSHASVALARPSTPHELREEVIERAADVEAISHKEVTRLIEEGPRQRAGKNGATCILMNIGIDTAGKNASVIAKPSRTRDE
jgi:hypothetical protein